MWVRNSVRAHNAVHAEVAVRGVITVEISAISENLHSVFTFGSHCLVYKVPDKTALKRGIFTDEVPVFLEPSHRISHCVGIFTLNKGFVGRFLFCIFFHAVVAVIHRAEDVCEIVHP